MKYGIHIYSHHFVVTGGDDIKSCLKPFVDELVEYETTFLKDGTILKRPARVFADLILKPSLHYRFHIELLDKFKEYLNSIGIEYEIIKHELHKAVDANFPPVNPKYTPYEYQEPIIDYIAQPGYKKVITLQTGRGKTAVFLHAMARIGKRTAMVLRPKYFERWIEVVDGKNKDALIPLNAGEDILVVKGKDTLLSLINLAKAKELTASLIIISSVTYQIYLSTYRKEGCTPQYGNVPPQFLWGLLGVGLIGVDEGHEHFHANFKVDLYSNVEKTVTLSATLAPDDIFLKKMYEVLYPTRLRMDGGKYITYADVYSVPYGIDNLSKIKTSWRGRKDYSQLAYETSILLPKNKKMLNNLEEMLCYDIDNAFLNIRMPEHKLLMFFDTVEMCKEFEGRIKKRYPDLKVCKYTAEEPYSVLHENDIIIATTKSADTGVDIPKLQVVLCFVARGSTASNLQMFGRLRQLKDKTHRPAFIYYYCTGIRQHLNYHEQRKDMFRNRTVLMAERPTYFSL